MGKKVTSFDVARRAGVSQPTVSRALRNLPGTSVQTRDRVRQAAAELSYLVSDSARILSTKRTRRIAIVSEELTNPYYPQLVEPIRARLALHDLRAVVITDTERSAVTLDVLADGSYDGVILTTTTRRSHLPRDLTARDIPHVLVNRVLDQPESPSCSFDNVSGTQSTADLLVDLGHTRIASIQGPVHTSTGRERAAGLRQALRSQGITMRPEHMVRSEFTHDSGFRAAQKVLTGPVRPSAIVCGNDVIALGVLSAARSLGVDVPGDLTVIGFDDISMAAWPLVELTTVRADLDELAAVATSQLLEVIAAAARQPHEQRVPVKLVARGTHAPPPSPGARP